MIKTESVLSDFIHKLEADEFFENIRITRAYPDVIKPTRLKNAVVAVGIKNIEVDENSIGQDIKSGSYSIFANIYVPHAYDKRSFEQIVFRICRDISELNVVAIEISEITVNSTAECLVMRSVFTFNDEICFKEESI